MSRSYSILLFLAITTMFSIGCDKDDPVIPNEEELITTLEVILTPTGAGDQVVLRFIDIDGDGGEGPTITTDDLTANTTYTGRIELSDESTTPAEDITAEVIEEDDEHQFFFDTDVPGLTVAYADADDNGNPLGQALTVTTTDAASGNFTITLRHEPDKSATGVAQGDITNAGGETDIEVTFAVNVQ